MEMSFADVREGFERAKRNYEKKSRQRGERDLTALVGQHDVALVVEVERLVPLLGLEELVTDFLHLQSRVEVLVEVNFVLVDLVL